VLVNQAFPLAVIFLKKTVDFYFTFYISVPEIGVSTSSCRTAITAEKEQRILQGCRNKNTWSALLVNCSKALITSHVVLLMIILGSLFRQVSLLLLCCRLREMEYLHYKSEKCYI